MSGHNLAEAIDNTDKGLINVSPPPAYGVQQSAVWSTLYTLFNGIAFHMFAFSILFFRL
jgi:hypothetical protein